MWNQHYWTFSCCWESRRVTKNLSAFRILISCQIDSTLAQQKTHLDIFKYKYFDILFTVNCCWINVFLEGVVSNSGLNGHVVLGCKLDQKYWRHGQFDGEKVAPSYFLEWRTWRTSSKTEIKVQSFIGALCPEQIFKNIRDVGSCAAC